MIAARRAALLCLAVAWLGCGDDDPAPPTQIVVVIDAETGVRAAAAELALVVRARSDDNASVHNETLRAADSTLQWPWRLALTPKDGDASRQFEVVATARDRDSAFVAQVRAISGFVKGETRQLDLTLEDDCLGRQCGGDETCRGGACVSAEVDPSSLPDYDADSIPEPIVVGPLPPDAGAGDGGAPVGPPVGGDGAAPPADSGVDAHVSPGCERNPDTTDEVCPEICPELCNGEDDDCDRRIDEGEGPRDECEDLPNARGRCELGRCEVGECALGFKDCDEDAVTGCESGPDDVSNCGTCRNACSYANMTALCVDNDCQPGVCLPLFGDCDGDGESCETPLTTLDDCRACGVTCTALQTPHAEPSCSSGTCGPGTCLGNYGDCNLVPGDGCEEELVSVEHCGGCTTPCDFVGSTGDDCSSGSCLATSCDTGYLDCDVDPTNGCESLSSGPHCGQCNRTCDDTLMNVTAASCGTGACVPMCDQDAGFGDCDSDPFNGCETSTLTLTHCAVCGVPCSRPNAVASCESGACELVRCNDGFDDCDGDGLSCEQSLSEDEHCGDCDIDCTVTARPHCAGGVCMAVDCGGDTADCDQSGDCETDLANDMNNCGACVNACTFTPGTTPHATLACVARACDAVCSAGYGDCNGDYRDGCEVALDTLSDCGGCGDGCSVANATETCVTGSCRVQSCDVDWDDCNGDDVSCETALDTTANCGSCGNGCDEPNAVMTCGGSPGARSCQISACTQAYFADCDELDGTGCEIDTRSATLHCGGCDDDCNDRPHVDGTHCENSACVVDSCDLGFDDCDPAPGCETQLGSLGTCGGCGDDCTQLPHTTATRCTNYACDVLTCEDGWADCDDQDADGCETDIFSIESCGGCEQTGEREPCTNLPNVASTSCDEGTCRIATCADGWVDCDGTVGNGCEQSLSTVGPCFPDTNCTRFVFQSRNYFFCTNDRNWGGALARCDMQVGGALVRIDGATENAFVLSHLTNPAWIGASDAAAEGQWSWIDDLGNPSLFFVAGSGGGPQNGAYVNWATGEPNASGNCGALVNSAGGPWGDDACTAMRDFVCEVQPDLCPNDPNKTFPGQCGCGTPDTDSDGDGTANCNDLCPVDPGKVAPGQCGCGTPDTDTDGDGTANCLDGCDDDPTKITPGACGCGVPDTDTDNDGEPDCVDPCPYIAGGSSAACAYPYTTSNFDPRDIDFSTALDVDFSTCGNADEPVLIDEREGNVYFSNWCGTAPTPHFLTSPIDGSPFIVLPMLSLYVPSGLQIRITGGQPVVFAVAGDALIEGYIDVRSIGNAEAGAGAAVLCKDAEGQNGGGAGALQAAGGGGGGGYGSNGGNGGDGTGNVAGGMRGGVVGNAEIIPLRPGCPGGVGGGSSGGSGTGGGGPRGFGGGAFQLSAAGLLRVRSGAAISASGGGGSTGDEVGEGGGGGGSGGSVLLEGAAISLDQSAWVTANGGGGGSGFSTAGGNAGTDGYPLSGVRAPGGLGSSGGGSGGFGASNAGNATAGGPGQWALIGTNRGGGGGGGGGVGRVRVNGALTCDLRSSFSPPPTSSCP